MSITGNTQLGVTKQQIIAAAVQKELKFRAILAQYVTDVSAFAVKGAKQISFPKLQSFTVQNRASATAGTPQALQASLDTLDLNHNAYVSWLIDGSDAIQTAIDARIEFARRAAAAHGRYVDVQIYTEVKNNAGFTATATALRDRILEARAWLRRNEAVLDETVIVASPEMETQLLQVQEFSRADMYGQAVIPAGVIGRLYGVPVVIHSALQNDEIFMWEKSGVALGFQAAPNYASQAAIEYGTTAVLEAMDQLFGVKALQIDQGTNTAAGKSALIAKVSGT
ncbi:MAG: phage capsid protein [Candidatus Bilamarchaeaceae archaeon]